MKVLLGLLLFSVLLLGCTANQQIQESASIQPENSITADVMENELTVTEKPDSTQEEIIPEPNVFSGKILAGSSSKLIDFNKADYEKALASDKIIVLYFYANWCPICKAEFPKMQEAFNELNYDNVVGFRVNYKDDETDSFETQLAQEFGVAYQHTKVFLKNGERIGKYPDSWDKARYLAEIEAVA